MIDLRLATPAICAWASGLAAIALPDGRWFATVLWGTAAAAAAVAVAARVASGRTLERRAGETRAVVAAVVCVAAAAAALVATACVVAAPSRRPDAVARLAGHTLVLRVEATSAPQSSTDSAAGGVRFSGTVTAVAAGGSSLSARMPVVVFAPSASSARIGQPLAVRGTMKMLPRSSETAALVYASAQPRPLERPPWPLAAADGVRARFSAQAGTLPGDGGALLPGLAIGDVHGLPDSLADDMKTVGLTHLTAVSGANCAVVVSLTGAAMGVVGFRRRTRAVASLAALAGFVVLVTPQPSVLRAAVMAAVIVAGGWVGRPGRALPALALAVVLLLAVDPWLAVSYGFALSVLATGALLLLAPPLSDRLARWMPSRVAALLAVPAAAQVACQPVLLMLNPSVPLYGMLANLVAGPAAAPATVLGLLSCAFGPLWPAAASVLAHLAWVPSAWIAAVARMSAGLPASAVAWADGLPGVVLMLVLSLGFVLAVARPLRPVPRIARSIALTIVAGVAVCSLAGTVGARVAQALDRPPAWSIAACDVGQGDAALVRSGDAYALVDTGPEPERLAACLSDLRVPRIDLLVLTHYDTDHVGGTPAVLGMVDLALVGPSSDDRGERLGERLARSGAKVRVAETGDAGRLGDLAWRVLWPDAERHGMRDGNERSVTVLFSGEGIRTLFLGDLDERAQGALLASGRVTHADVVKMAHHGSSDQSEALYREVGAVVGLISCGAGNDYGHPTRTGLEILRRAGTRGMRTDVQGMLMVSSDGRGGLRTWTQRASTPQRLARPG